MLLFSLLLCLILYQHNKTTNMGASEGVEGARGQGRGEGEGEGEGEEKKKSIQHTGITIITKTLA